MEQDKRSIVLFGEIIDQIKQNTVLQKNIQQLVNVWSDVWPEEEVKERHRILLEECVEAINNFINDLLVDELEKRSAYVTEVEGLLKLIIELSEDLGVSISHDDMAGRPFHVIAHTLNQRVEKYRVMKEERLRQVQVLKDEEIVLCDKLGVKPNKIEFNRTPSEEQLKLMSHQVQCLREEECRRKHLFQEKRMLIIKMFDQLEIKPSLNFERELISEDYECSKLTHDIMSQVAELEQNLSTQVEAAKEKVDELKHKLSNVWNYLEQPLEYTQEFLKINNGYGLNTIKNLKKELENFEQLKRQNIRKIVIKIREVLVEEWNKCMISEEERNEFSHFTSDCFTEDLCELHEMEIEKLRKYYEEHEKIFTLLLKWKQLFANLLELEKNPNNVNRYKNRGCTLLQEEKERKKVKKDLPKVEEELKLLLKQYKYDNNNAEFKSFGVPVEKMLETEWSSHFNAKTAQVLTRFASGGKLGSNCKRLCPTPSDNTASSAKKGKYGGSDSKTNLRTPVAREKTENSITYRSRRHLNYDEFEKGIMTNKTLRSTSLTNLAEKASKVLKEIKQPGDCRDAGPSTRSGTPHARKTPMKLTTPKKFNTPATVPRQKSFLNVPVTPNKLMKLTPSLSTTRRNKLPQII